MSKTTTRRPRLLGALAATLLFAVSALVIAPPPAQAQTPTPPVQSGGLSVEPTRSPGGVKRSSFDFVVAVDGVQDDSVTVSNLSNERKSYFLYVADALT